MNSSISFFAVVIGGALGCVSRWLLGMALNMIFPAIPPGTLVANLLALLGNPPHEMIAAA